MAKQKTIRLKHSEINHLLSALDHLEYEGVYWGRKDHFQKRHAAVTDKLEIAAKTNAEKTSEA